MCDCMKNLKIELGKRGMHEVEFVNMLGENQVTLPITYRVKNDKTGELTKRIYKSRYIPLYCPFCGIKLRTAEKYEEQS